MDENFLVVFPLLQTFKILLCSAKTFVVIVTTVRLLLVLEYEELSSKETVSSQGNTTQTEARGVKDGPACINKQLHSDTVARIPSVMYGSGVSSHPWSVTAFLTQQT